MVDVIALKKKMLEMNILNKDLEIALGLSKSAVHRKLKGESEFDREEIKQLISLLHLTCAEVMLIFFKIQVS